MLASIFVIQGVRALTKPDASAEAAHRVTDRVGPLLEKADPRIPTDARTLVRLSGAVPTELAEASQALETAVGDLVAAAVREGVIRDDVRAGALMMALHGISGALGRPDWRGEADDLVGVLIGGLRPS